MNYAKDEARQSGYFAQGLWQNAASPLQGDIASRQSAKDALRDRVAQLRREAERLDALLKALPEELPAAADAALWEIAIRIR